MSLRYTTSHASEQRYARRSLITWLAMKLVRRVCFVGLVGIRRVVVVAVGIVVVIGAVRVDRYAAVRVHRLEIVIADVDQTCYNKSQINNNNIETKHAHSMMQRRCRRRRVRSCASTSSSSTSCDVVPLSSTMSSMNSSHNSSSALALVGTRGGRRIARTSCRHAACRRASAAEAYLRTRVTAYTNVSASCAPFDSDSTRVPDGLPLAHRRLVL
jgi:hypothetical protein